jgi:heterodisulfide reductase subunit B
MGNARHYENPSFPYSPSRPAAEELTRNCCGATAYFSVDETMAAAICGRNLSLAERIGKDLIAPCAGCYLTLRKSNAFLTGPHPQAAKILNDLKNAGCEYQDGQIRTPLDVLVRDIRSEGASRRSFALWPG